MTTMIPATESEALDLLVGLGAPPRLLRHVELVGEAASELLGGVCRLGLTVEADLVRVGVVLHDAGKTLHPAELNEKGALHEPAGEELLLEKGASPEVARICRSHAQWAGMDVSIEELLVALADKLWKGVRNTSLEQLVIDRVASRLDVDPWDVFTELDSLFETIANGGTDRLERSWA